jgi:16S rRNA (guanine527-N7)-methyltransferase
MLPAHEPRLRSLLDAFLRENAHINLSAFRTPELCWTGNVLDSLAYLDLPPELRPTKEGKMLDVGTGGGFPLLPLGICLPQSQLTGLDATRKKLEAIGRIANELQLQNVNVLCGRAEELGHDTRYREQFDVVLSRAVAPLNVLLEYCSPFAKPGGKVILWKSLSIEQELQDSLLARAELSCHLVGQHEYSLGPDWGTRQLLVFEKGGKLSGKYPRGVGVPKKEPLR